MPTQAFRVLMNRLDERARMPEYVARYCDYVVRRSKPAAAQVALHHAVGLVDGGYSPCSPHPHA
jgi:hypothetical protein